MLGLGSTLGTDDISPCEYTGGNCNWSPADISSLTHWYRRGVTQLTTTLLDILHVYEWQDVKGTNDLTTTASTSAAPKSVEEGAVFFDINTHTLLFDSELSLGQFAIYIKCKFDSFLAEAMMEKGTSDFLQISTSQQAKIKVAGNRHDYTLPATLVADTPFNIGYERTDTAATTDDVMQVYLNGVVAAQEGVGDGTQVITDLLALTSIGIPVQDSVWYEVVICNASLSANDRADLNTWLNNV